MFLNYYAFVMTFVFYSKYFMIFILFTFLLLTLEAF